MAPRRVESALKSRLGWQLSSQPHPRPLLTAFIPASHLLSVLLGQTAHSREQGSGLSPAQVPPPHPVPASPEGDLQPRGAPPQALGVLVPQLPARSARLPAVRAASLSLGSHLPPPKHARLGTGHLPHLRVLTLLPRKVKLGVLGSVQFLRHTPPSVPNQMLLFLGAESLPGMWAVAQRPGALSRGSPGLQRDRLLPAAGQMEPQWWGLLPARCARSVSAFKAAFVPGACSRKNHLAAPPQKSVRPLGSTGSALQPAVGPRSETPTGCHLPPAAGQPGGRIAHQGGGVGNG